MSRAYYVLCLVPAIAGVVVGARVLGNLDDRIADMPRMIIPGSHAFTLAEGTYVVYGERTSVIEGRSYDNDAFTFETPCSLVDGANRPLALVPIERPNAATYRRSGYHGTAMFDVAIESTGRYTLRCEGDGTGDAIVAVGEGIRSRAAFAMLAFAGGPGVGIAAALLLYFRRRKAVQRARG